MTVNGTNTFTFTNYALDGVWTVGENAAMIVDDNLNLGTATVNLAGALRVSGNITGASAITVAAGNTLDIGEHTLTATSITGGVLKATLTDAATTNPIITANATNVTLVLNMDAASARQVTEYRITNGTGFTFGDYDTEMFVVSANPFNKSAARTVGVLNGWTGGSLYILRLTGDGAGGEAAGEAAIGELTDRGIPVSENERKAVEALNDEVVDALSITQKAAAQKVNDLLETASAAGDTAQMKQILREVAPEAAPAVTQSATSNAGAVIAVVGTRMGGNIPEPFAVGNGVPLSSPRGVKGTVSGHGVGVSPVSRRAGRSGGDYIVGSVSLWAQGLYNKAELKKTDGFESDSRGFAAGLEYAFTDSFKAGFGYAYAATDIDTDRSRTSVDTHTGFVYGEYNPERFFINAVASYGRSDYDEKTRLAGLRSDYRADTIAAQVMTGYAGVLTPEAGVRYMSVRQKEYTNALGVKMADKTSETWTAAGGLKASKTFRTGRNATVTPEIRLGATYDFARDSQARTVTLANGSSYVAQGAAMPRFGVEASAGLSATFGKASLGISYEGKFKKDYTDHTALFNVRYNF